MAELTPLSTKKAMELYKLVGPYLPKRIDMDKPAIEFISAVVNSIKDGKFSVYVDSVLLMTGMELRELSENYSSTEVLGLFVEGLMRNRILEMEIFFRSLGVVHD